MRDRVGVGVVLLLVVVAGLSYQSYPQAAGPSRLYKSTAPGDLYYAYTPASSAQQPLRELTAAESEIANYTWEAPPIDSSLGRQLDRLTPEERRVREWLRTSRPQWQRGVGVGLGQSTPPEPLGERPATVISRMPKADEGPGSFTGGDAHKYMDLVREWQLGRQESQCDAARGTLTRYAERHHRAVAGEIPPRYAQFACATGHDCGGFADRMNGISATLIYSILTNRTFVASWDHPMPLDLLFDAISIDWSVPLNVTENGASSPSVGKAKPLETSTRDLMQSWVSDPIFEFDFMREWPLEQPEVIQLSINRGVALRSFTFPTIRPLLLEHGLTMENIWPCTFDAFFRPKFSVLEHIAEYSSFFALPTIFSIGIQIRTGDGTIFGGESADTPNTVERHRVFFDCAAQVERVYARSGQKVVYYLITDSVHLKQDAHRVFPDKTVTADFRPFHLDAFRWRGGTNRFADPEGVDGTMDAIAENWIFSTTDFSILSHASAFGVIPTLRRGKLGRSISVHGTYSMGGGEPAGNVDCSLDSALFRHTDYADAWFVQSRPRARTGEQIADVETGRIRKRLEPTYPAL